VLVELDVDGAVWPASSPLGDAADTTYLRPYLAEQTVTSAAAARAACLSPSTP
jgi:hypothetical protein